MIYFIPAWYKAGSWSENEQTWHARRLRTEFDDTVKHIQLFHRNNFYDYMVMLLSYTPNFRHFLHRQSVYHAPYWSCFDAMLSIRRKRVMNFSFHNLAWPEGVEFVYSPFVVIAYLKGMKYAEVEFGEDGNMIEVTMFSGDQVVRKNIYDDRGFISSTIVYRDGKPATQDFLMEDGIWKIRMDLADGRIKINPECDDYLIEYNDISKSVKYKRNNYTSMGEVVKEVVSEFLAHTEDRDIFCMAMHERHSDILGEVLKDKKYIMSFYADRYPIGKITELKALISDSSYVITDSRENMQVLKKVYGNDFDIIDITPYDTRVDKGISQQLHVKQIMVPVDDLPEHRFKAVITHLAAYLTNHNDTHISLFTRNAKYNIKDEILKSTRDVLEAAGYEPGWAESEKDVHVRENNLEDEEQIEIKFEVEQCIDEIDVTGCMRKQRLILDLRDTPELYLQVSAVSIGIPQIVVTGTQFIEDKKNGFIIKGPEEIGEKVSFYLDNLSNWNEAVISSYELGRKFTTGVLINKWKEVLKAVE